MAGNSLTDALREKICALIALDDRWADASIRGHDDRVRPRDRIMPIAMNFARSTEATARPQAGADGDAILRRYATPDAARFLSK